MDLFTPESGGIRITLPEGLVGFLEDVPAALDLVGTVDGDPAGRRLRPEVYPEDTDADAEYWKWMGSELDESRSADRSAFRELVSSAGSGVVASPAEAESFLRVLVEIRLALAARLGVETEEDYARLGETDTVVLDTLAELQALLLAALRR